MGVARYLLLPWWTAQLATGAKSFCDNPVIGSRRLNRLGLHVARMRIAASLAASRRHRLRHLLSDADRAAFDRDGFVLRRDFLPAAAFAELQAEALGYSGPARETVQGDTVTRRLALDPPALAAMPAVRSLLRSSEWRGLLRYVGSFDSEPLLYIQTILSHAYDGPPDPQTALHADTFHPTMKAWLFLTDVAEDEGPFIYVPGSHIKSPARLTWEKARSARAAHDLDRLSARGSLRVGVDELAGLGLPQPKCFAVPANTLVVADTSGFHARGPSVRPSVRVEIWALCRRNPFLPWAGLDLLSFPGIAERRVPWLWAVQDHLSKMLGHHQHWRDVGVKTPGAPARQNDG
jgi:hypothetical protein